MSSKPIQRLIQLVEESKVPLGEDNDPFLLIKGKVARGEPLNDEEDAFLRKLVQRASEWLKDIAESAATEPEDTLSG